MATDQKKPIAVTVDTTAMPIRTADVYGGGGGGDDCNGYNSTAPEKKIVETRDSRFGEYLVTHETNPWTPAMLRLYLILFVVFMNSAASGFDGNTFGGVSAVKNFQQRFGTDVAATQGFLAAIYILGASCPCLSHPDCVGAEADTGCP